MFINYDIEYTLSSQLDVKRMRRYILERFKYVELAERFDKKILRALKIIQKAPTIYQPTSFSYNGYEVYMRSIDSYLFFYIVRDTTVIILRILKDGMNWLEIVRGWIEDDMH